MERKVVCSPMRANVFTRRGVRKCEGGDFIG
jgi:hypothetical protein